MTIFKITWLYIRRSAEIATQVAAAFADINVRQYTVPGLASLIFAARDSTVTPTIKTASH
jgi:hypothetical protein